MDESVDNTRRQGTRKGNHPGASAISYKTSITKAPNSIPQGEEELTPKDMRILRNIKIWQL